VVWCSTPEVRKARAGARLFATSGLQPFHTSTAPHPPHPRSRTALWWFVACNVILAGAFFVSFALALAVVRGDVGTCACSSTCARALRDAGLADVSAVCAEPGYYRAMFWLSMAAGVAMAALQVAGAVLGCRLASAPRLKAAAAWDGAGAGGVPVVTVAGAPVPGHVPLPDTVFVVLPPHHHYAGVPPGATVYVTAPPPAWSPPPAADPRSPTRPFAAPPARRASADARDPTVVAVPRKASI
jgi:hypothetical protein